jgi:hypothetical protein
MSMKRILPVALASLASVAALGISSTSDADPKLASETRSVSAFHGIELAGTLGVEVTVGKPASVQVHGEADLLDKVTTAVKDGILVLDTPRDLHRRNHLRAVVTVPDLSSISLSGTGGMTVSGVANDRLAISLGGTGAVALNGTTGSLQIVVDGTGQLNAKDLTAKAVAVEVNGTGQAIVHATDSLEAKVTGTGAIDVHGHPARVKKNVSGVGAIHIR